MSSNGKRQWFNFNFRHDRPPENPAKTDYKNLLRDSAAVIKACGEVSGLWKKTMSLRMAEVKKLAKAKNYEQAVDHLRALERTARITTNRSLVEADNVQGDLQTAAKRLTRVRYLVERNGVDLGHPSFEERELAIRQLIEDADADRALQLLDVLQPRVEALALEAHARRVVQTHQLELPQQLQTTLDGIGELMRQGRVDEAQQQLTPVVEYVDHVAAYKRHLKRARDEALGKGDEIDSWAKLIQPKLDEGNTEAAFVQIEALGKWVVDQARRKETVAQQFQELTDLMDEHSLTPQRPVDRTSVTEDFNKAMSDGELNFAEELFDRLQRSIGPSADRVRVGQVLERLLRDEKELRRLDARFLVEHAQIVREHVKSGDGKKAQFELKKIQDAIAKHLEELSPAAREKAEVKAVELQFDRRLARMKEMVKLKDSSGLQDCIKAFEKLERPLDRTRQARAIELYTQALVLSTKGKFSNGGNSANSVLMLKNPDVLTKGTKVKQFFKPVSGESSQPGFPKGGGASREVVGKQLADQLRHMTGLPINVAETHLVELPPDALPKDMSTEPVLGSMQHNIHHKGDPVQRPLSDLPGSKLKPVLDKLPVQQVQAKQIYDLVFLNLDVHPGNVFVKGEGEGGELHGIDNGMGLPSREGLMLRAEAFGEHALSSYALNDKPFTQEMTEAIDKMDPEALGNAVKQSFAEMKDRFPDSEATSDDKLNDEHVGIMKASVRFLKKAAKELTVNQLHNAYLVNMQDIFGLRGEQDPRNEEARFADVIKAAKQRGEALEECLANADAIIQKANRTGWILDGTPPRGFMVAGTLLKFYPEQYLTIWKSDNLGKGPLPVKPPEPTPVKVDTATDQETRLFASWLQRQPRENADELELAHLRAYLELGGDAKAQSLGAALSASGAYFVPSHRHALLYQLIQLHDRLTKL